MHPPTLSPALEQALRPPPHHSRLQPDVESLLDQLSMVKRAVAHLKAAGYAPFAAYANADLRPVVQVACCRRCHDAVGAGEASYGLRSATEMHGRFHARLFGVEVVWTETVQP